ncbi:hypothetical protein ACFQ8C_14150 [Streptomyces sp. NPDC056503]|uniref:hypothetical protein n=1 Tax=Streptomyces sp. NPDC056503 TaxID=3345842 RepID=UPI0036B15536
MAGPRSFGRPAAGGFAHGTGRPSTTVYGCPVGLRDRKEVRTPGEDFPVCHLDDRRRLVP